VRYLAALNHFMALRSALGVLGCIRNAEARVAGNSIVAPALFSKALVLGVCRDRFPPRLIFGLNPSARFTILSMGKSFLPDDVNQSLLFPPSLHDWLPENHLSRFLVDVVRRLT